MRHGVSVEPAQSESRCATIAMTPTTRCKCIPHAVGTRKCTSIDLLVPFGRGTSMADRPLGGLIQADRLYRLTCSGTSYTCHGCGRSHSTLNTER
ncbi:hypothetical protein BCR44DRAFT_1438989 [Catenaria anguillulae PL171]|uniref:Uncharacterized protein n=1 Tax=Catenaria anguillulae PL171 TaxID=765915 RepID=A0A1Y2HEN3_9FUNG|nr:hypothetical protein BCR44DRAFT_1438989 [Catenaria anguillulae PL171]